ncbi:MAG: hypothetical protein ACRD3I_12670, partial [Terriglobales bacterium]
MMSFLLSIFLSFLPRRYRIRLSVYAGMDLRNGALVSGIIEGFVCLGIFIVRYLGFIQAKVGELGERAIAKGAEGVLAAPAVQYGMGYVSMVEYLLHPLTWLVIYFALEGTVRAVAAATTEETIGTLPLHVVAWADEKFGDWRMERALGPRVADIVESIYSPDYDLRIFTCRPKRNWDRMITVSYQGQFYEVLGQQDGKSPQPFVYRLRKSKPGRVVRAVHDYDPEEVLRNVSDPSLAARITAWFGSRRAQRRAQQEMAPLVPDLVERIQGEDYELRIASCRPKAGWDNLMTVKYKDVYYEVVYEKPGPPAYPYV